jgi:predicted small lipoprotein YifL
MNNKILIFVALMAVVFLVLSCGQKEPVELMHYPVDNTEGIITQTDVEIDIQITADGNGSLKITAEDSTVCRLFEVGDIDVENARLVYQAKVRTENVAGKAYLEMWCHFPGKGEFFSRGLQTALTGSSDWNRQETFFFLRKGENPDNVKLNLVISGKGTAWIDDIHLLKGPLN